MYQESYSNSEYFKQNTFSSSVTDHILNNSEDDTKSLFLIIKVQISFNNCIVINWPGLTWWLINIKFEILQHRLLETFCSSRDLTNMNLIPVGKALT